MAAMEAGRASGKRTARPFAGPDRPFLEMSADRRNRANQGPEPPVLYARFRSTVLFKGEIFTLSSLLFYSKIRAKKCPEP